MNNHTFTPRIVSLFTGTLARRSAIALVCGFSACSSGEIKQYKVPKAPVKRAAAPINTIPSTEVTYTTPKDWVVQPASGMRKASLKTPDGGDMSVVTLPAQSGDLKSNVNRWRGQVGLAPLQEDAAISKSLKPVQIDGAPAVELELYAPEDKDNKAMRVVLLQKDGQRWFLKLSGTREVIKAQGSNFETFTRSFAIAGKATSTQANTQSSTQGGTPAMTSPSQLPLARPDASLAYTLPENWREKEKGAMRLASFAVESNGQTADVSVVTLAGDGGGLLENTNRWRRQLEMAPTSQEGLKNSVKDITVDGNKGYFMALYTNLDGSGMLVSLVEREGLTWFIKMMGPASLIQSQEQTFQDFLQSIRFEGDQ